MIIKRRVTRGFVQIANEVVRDRRISLEAHGVLHYLLSLPDNWEVNLKQIEKFWSIGRDKRRRIFGELQKFGWAQLERQTTEDGTFLGQRWIIGDEPGAEIPDSGAIEDHDDEEDAESLAPTMNTTAAPESQGPDALVSGDRETPSQAVGSPDGRISRPPEKASLLIRKTPEEENLSTNTMADVDEIDTAAEPPPPFGAVLRLWPSDNVASGYACEKSFGKLTDWQKVQAHRAIKPYLDECRGRGQTRLCDLRTFLDERRFEKFTSKGSTGRQFFLVRFGTPQDNAKVERWREYFRKTAPHKLGLFEQMIRGSGYTTETEWPPAVAA